MAQWIGLGGTINRKFIDVPMKIMGFSCEFPVIFPLNQSIEWPYLYIPPYWTVRTSRSKVGITVAGGHGCGSGADQLSHPGRMRKSWENTDGFRWRFSLKPIYWDTHFILIYIYICDFMWINIPISICSLGNSRDEYDMNTVILDLLMISSLWDIYILDMWNRFANPKGWSKWPISSAELWRNGSRICLNHSFWLV